MPRHTGKLRRSQSAPKVQIATQDSPAAEFYARHDARIRRTKRREAAKAHRPFKKSN